LSGATLERFVCAAIVLVSANAVVHGQEPGQSDNYTASVLQLCRQYAMRQPRREYRLMSCSGNAWPNGIAKSPQDRGLHRISILVPMGCAEGLLHLARELRARQRAGMSSPTAGWRRLSPSTELFVDPSTGARCAVRDTGAPGSERYSWTISAFGDHQVAADRAGELTAARALAEAALTEYIAALG
jgi:hypothetical protein